MPRVGRRHDSTPVRGYGIIGNVWRGKPARWSCIVVVDHYSQSNAQVTRFGNGMTVALERLPYLRSATVSVWVRAGSMHETPEENGIAHFIEHLLFKGTKTRSAHDLMDAIEGRGGHFNAYTSRGYTCYYIRILQEHVPVAIEILSDIVKNSLFNDMDKERGVILEEIASAEDTPDDLIHDLLSEFHWPGHALGRPIAGTEDTVSAISREMVNDYFTRSYNPSNTFFVIVGNFDEERVLAQLQTEFEGEAPGPLNLPGEPPVFNAGSEIHEREISQCHVTLAYPGPALGTADRYICDLTSTVLGGGSTSRLFERIREDEGLAYNIQSFHSFYPGAGVLGVYAAVAPENYHRCMELIYEEIRKLRDAGLEEEELRKNREQLKGYMLMSLESTSARASRIGKSLMHYGRIIGVDEVLGHLESVSPDDVQRFCREVFTVGNTAHVVLGPEDGPELAEIAL
jgi:predicted Zn-dependent peptidase